MENPEPPPQLPPFELPEFKGFEVPPAALQPPVDLPRVPQRTPIGWILLAMVFLLYGGMIVATLTILPKPKQGNYYSAEAEIRTTMYMRSAAGSFAPSMNKAGGLARQVDSKSVSRLREDAPKDGKAARLLVAAEFEEKDAVDAPDLERLKKSKAKPDLVMASIYGTKSLTAQQAQNLSEQLPNTEFAYQLAKVHAHDKAGDSKPRMRMAPAWRGMVATAIIGIYGLLFLGGFVMWAVYFGLRKNGQLQPKGHPTEPLSLVEADRLALRAGMLLMGFLGIEIVVSGITLAFKGPLSLTLALSSLIMLIFVIAIHKFPIWDMKIPLSRIGVSTKDFKTDVLWGLAAYMAAVPIIAVTLVIGVLLMKVFGESTHPAAELIQSGFNVWTVLAVLLAGAVVAPFWEEIMFRGTLMPALSKVLGKPWMGIALSSFLFAAIHPQGVPLWLGLGSIGAINGMLAYQTKSLIPSIVLHTVHNSLLLGLAVIMTS